MDIIAKFKSLDEKEKHKFLNNAHKKNIVDKLELFQYIFEFEPNFAKYIYQTFGGTGGVLHLLQKNDLNKIYRGVLEILHDKQGYQISTFLDIFPELGKVYFDDLLDRKDSQLNSKINLLTILTKYNTYLPIYKLSKYNDKYIMTYFLLDLLSEADNYPDSQSNAKRVIKDVVENTTIKIDLDSILNGGYRKLYDEEYFIDSIKMIFKKYKYDELIKLVNKYKDYQFHAQEFELLTKVIPDVVENYKNSLQTKNVEIEDIENPFDYLEGLDLDKTNVVDDISNVIIKYKEELDGEIPLRIIDFLEETEVFDWLPLIMEYPEILDNMESLTMQGYEYLGNYRAVPEEAFSNPIYQDALSALEDSTRISGNLIKEIVLEAIRKLLAKL